MWPRYLADETPWCFMMHPIKLHGTGFVCFCSPICLSLRLHAGPIPAELGSLSALVWLDLKDNKLSGE